MSFKWVEGYNYVDFFSYKPFSIYSCRSTTGREIKSLQTFPVRSMRDNSSAEAPHRATLWALDSGCLFNVVLGHVALCSEVDDKSVKSTGSQTEKKHEIALSPNDFKKITLVVETRQYKGQLRSFAAIAILDTRILSREDFVNCILAQLTDVILFEREKESPTTLFYQLFYHSLFTIPISRSDVNAYVVCNPHKDRICIDFQQKDINWRHNRKLRQVISSNRFVVVVNRDIKDSLRLAKEYHVARAGGTWLDDEYIGLLAEMADDSVFGVQLLSVEVVEKSTGKVLAGCLGYSVGSVYHDFTMFTAQRSRESFGTIATKLLGEALQACGYNMWYWGLHLDYMTQFCTKYAARGLSRAEFCARWFEHREKQPSITLMKYFQSGMSMLPYMPS